MQYLNASSGCWHLERIQRGVTEHSKVKGAHRWQNPLMNFALYIMSAAISIRRMRYMVSKYVMSSDLVVVTVVPGPSMW